MRFSFTRALIVNETMGFEVYWYILYTYELDELDLEIMDNFHITNMVVLVRGSIWLVESLSLTS